MSKVYDRLAEEGDQSWSAFQKFRDLGVDRSLPQVAEGCAKSVSLMKRWSARYTWAERARAWDMEQDHVRQDAANKAVAKVAAKAAEKRELTKDAVLAEAAAIAFSSLTNAASWNETTLTLKPSDELPPEVAASIESIELRHDKEGNPIRKIKLHSKVPMLTKLGEHYQLWGKEAGIQSPTANFFQFFLEAGRSGEIEREMKRRGLMPTAPGEVIPPPPTDDSIEIEAGRNE